MFGRTKWIRAAVVAVVVAVVAIPTAALAHETRAVGGKFEMVVGWSGEPAYQGQLNGVDLRVRLPAVAPATPVPVEGVEKTLQVEVKHIASGKSVTLPIETVFGTPGRYIAHLLPTVDGQYSFRYFGTINGTAVNETFTSGEKFASIESTDEIQFPEKVAQVREVQVVASQAMDSADSADSSASSAKTIAYIAIGLAVLAGVGAGASFAMGRKK
jgi:hypothetical protein